MGTERAENQAWIISQRQAARFMNVSLSHFRSHIAPSLPSFDLAPAGSKKRMPRYSIADLEGWMEQRREVA